MSTIKAIKNLFPGMSNEEARRHVTPQKAGDDNSKVPMMTQDVMDQVITKFEPMGPIDGQLLIQQERQSLLSLAEAYSKNPSVMRSLGRNGGFLHALCAMNTFNVHNFVEIHDMFNQLENDITLQIANTSASTQGKIQFLANVIAVTERSVFNFVQQIVDRIYADEERIRTLEQNISLVGTSQSVLEASIISSASRTMDERFEDSYNRINNAFKVLENKVDRVCETSLLQQTQAGPHSSECEPKIMKLVQQVNNDREHVSAAIKAIEVDIAQIKKYIEPPKPPKVPNAKQDPGRPTASSWYGGGRNNSGIHGNTDTDPILMKTVTKSHHNNKNQPNPKDHVKVKINNKIRGSSKDLSRTSNNLNTGIIQTAKKNHHKTSRDRRTLDKDHKRTYPVIESLINADLLKIQLVAVAKISEVKLADTVYERWAVNQPSVMTPSAKENDVLVLPLLWRTCGVYNSWVTRSGDHNFVVKAAKCREWYAHKGQGVDGIVKVPIISKIQRICEEAFFASRDKNKSVLSSNILDLSSFDQKPQKIILETQPPIPCISEVPMGNGVSNKTISVNATNTNADFSPKTLTDSSAQGGQTCELNFSGGGYSGEVKTNPSQSH